MNLFPTAALPHCLFSIIIPAKDEAENLPYVVKSLMDQVTLDGTPYPRERFEILILINNSQDDSIAVAKELACTSPIAVHVAELNGDRSVLTIGALRRMMMDEASNRLGEEGIICSIDADAVADRYWLAHTEQAISRGCHAVAGRIEVSHTELSRGAHRDVSVTSYNEKLHQLTQTIYPKKNDPFPSHHYEGGASIAVTKKSYIDAGGMPPLPHFEDVTFFRNLRKRGAIVRHDPNVRVSVSARQDGRCEKGMARTLHEFETCRHEPVVVCPVQSVLFARRQEEVEKLWNIPMSSKDFHLKVCRLYPKKVTALRIAQLYRKKAPFGGVEVLHAEMLEKESKISLSEALHSLRILEQSFMRKVKRNVEDLANSEVLAA